MRIVVGLGNPGTEYVSTRHNVGFMTVERLAGRWHIGLKAERRGVRIGEGRVAGVPTTLVQPLRYMNRSGEALGAIGLQFGAEDLIVVYDDIDLPVGRLRVRPEGGSGGHRGIESLVRQCGRHFNRVRIGVGRPPEGMDAAEYVLMPLTAPEQRVIDSVVERASDAVECLLVEGMEQAMNRFNVRAAGRYGEGEREFPEE